MHGGESLHTTVRGQYTPVHMENRPSIGHFRSHSRRQSRWIWQWHMHVPQQGSPDALMMQASCGSKAPMFMQSTLHLTSTHAKRHG